MRQPNRSKHGKHDFYDHREERFKNLPADYSRAKHRKIGPPNKPTIFDMTPEEMARAKRGAYRT